MTTAPETPALALPDLASHAVGGTVVACSDEFFAEVDNLLKPGESAHQPYTFGPKGQVYDGWETRRRRTPGDDWALVRLGVPGVVRAVVVDTAHFLGNFPESCAVEACHAPGYPDAAALGGAEWTTIVPRSPLTGGDRHEFPVSDARYATHLRLTIHPDGGVARLRAHGEPVPDPAMLAGMPLDLAAMENGGRITGCSDRFFGAPGNLLLPGLAQVMGEGWETRRRRGAGNDWVTIALAAEGVVRVVDLDTRHFKGNSPGEAALLGFRAAPGAEPPEDPAAWTPLLPRTPLRPDTRHRFRVDGTDAPPVTHVRLDIFPDGGVARLRLFGDLTPDGAAAVGARWRALAG
ncbi:MAG TPA: allantoicase [Streptosporangiaceae bacterium]